MLAVAELVVGGREDKNPHGKIIKEEHPLRVGGQSLTLRAAVMPTEFFEYADGKILELACVGKYVLVRYEEKGKSGWVAFNQSGEKIECQQNFPGVVLSHAQLCAVTTSSSNKIPQIVISNRGEGYSLADLIKEYGLPKWEREELKRQLTQAYEVKTRYQYGASEDLKWLDLRAAPQKPDPVINLPYILHNDVADRIVIFERDGKYVVYQTADEKGQALLPSEWKRLDVESPESIVSSFPRIAGLLNVHLNAGKYKAIDDTPYGVLLERGLVKVVKLANEELAFSDAAVGYVAAIKGKTKNLFFFSKKDGATTINRIDLDKLVGINTAIESRKLPIKGELLEIKLDSNSNFLFAVTLEQGQKRMSVIESDTLNVVLEVPDVSEKFDFDVDGNVYFVDSQGKLRLIQTNLKEIPVGGLDAYRKERQTHLVALDQALPTLELPKARIRYKAQPPKSTSEGAVLESSKKRLLDLVRPELAAANSLEAISLVEARIEKLKEDPTLSKFPEIFIPVVRMVAERIDTVRVAQFETTMQSFRESLPELDTAEELARLDLAYVDLCKQRRQLVIVDVVARERVDSALKTIAKDVDKAKEAVKGELSASIQGRLDRLNRLIGSASNLGELNAIQGSDEAVEFSRLLCLVSDPAEHSKWQSSYDQALFQRKSDLERETEIAAERERIRLAKILEESRAILEDLEISLGIVKNAADLLVLRRTSPLVIKHSAKILALPEDLRRVEQDKLDGLFTAKKKTIDGKVILQSPTAANEANFGHEVFPIYKETTLVWQPKVEAFKDEAVGQLVYVSNHGRVFKPDIEPVPISIEDEATKKAIALTRVKAAQYFERQKHRPVQMNPLWVVNDYYREVLSDLARMAKLQTPEWMGRGICILEGEAGVGKNVVIHMFCHFTNRQEITFSCNGQTEKEDLMYAFHYDPKKGTYYVDSRLIEMIQTPGTVITFDEINALPPPLAKFLNPLFGEDRCLNLPDGRVIKAHPSVLFFGAMNPSSYLGVTKLSPEVKSRAMFMLMDYPDEKYSKSGKYAPYEAEILAQYMKHASKLSQSEFYQLWDYLVNGDKTNGGDRLLNREIEKEVVGIYQIVRCANRIRAAYQNYKTGRSTEMVNFVFSLRETTTIAMIMHAFSSPKEAIKNVVIPKIEDPEERDRVRLIIEQV